MQDRIVLMHIQSYHLMCIRHIVEVQTDIALRWKAYLNENSTYTLELWHSIYGNMCVQQVHSTNEIINIAGLPSGTYALVLKENGDIFAQTKVMIP